MGACTDAWMDEGRMDGRREGGIMYVNSIKVFLFNEE